MGKNKIFDDYFYGRTKKFYNVQQIYTDLELEKEEVEALTYFFEKYGPIKYVKEKKYVFVIPRNMRKSILFYDKETYKGEDYIVWQYHESFTYP